MEDVYGSSKLFIFFFIAFYVVCLVARYFILGIKMKLIKENKSRLINEDLEWNLFYLVIYECFSRGVIFMIVYFKVFCIECKVF